jgi:methionine-rich copper-binding protein CopC
VTVTYSDNYVIGPFIAADFERTLPPPSAAPIASPVTIPSPGAPPVADVPSGAPVSQSPTPTVAQSPVEASAIGGGSNTGAIVGGVIGGVVGLALIIIIIVLVLRKRGNNKKDEEMTPAESKPESKGKSKPQESTKPLAAAPNTTACTNMEGGDAAASEPAVKKPSKRTGKKKPKRTVTESTLRADADWKIKYEDITLEKELGAGAYGVVWRGVWASSKVAIKQSILGSNSSKAIEDMNKEAELMCNLRPHANGANWIATMDFILGTSLTTFFPQCYKSPVYVSTKRQSCLSQSTAPRDPSTGILAKAF